MLQTQTVEPATQSPIIINMSGSTDDVVLLPSGAVLLPGVPHA